MIDYHFNLIHASNVKSDYLNLTGVTSGAGSANPSGHLILPPVFSGVRVARSLVFFVVFCE